jgi:NAD-dependent oxidoreductase involved in siderophore biosynthesis
MYTINPIINSNPVYNHTKSREHIFCTSINTPFNCFSSLHVHECWNVGFEVLTAVVMKRSFLWGLTLYSPLKVKRRFGATYRLHRQGKIISRARNQRQTTCSWDTQTTSDQWTSWIRSNWHFTCHWHSKEGGQVDKRCFHFKRDMCPFSSRSYVNKRVEENSHRTGDWVVRKDYWQSREAGTEFGNT